MIKQIDLYQNSKQILLTLLLSFLSIFTTSCSPSTFHPYPKGSVPLLPVSATSELKARLSQQSLPNDAKFLLKINLRYGDQLNSFRQGVVFKYPSSFRIETYPPQAAWTINYFITDGKDFVYSDTNEDLYERGAYQADLFSKYYQIPLSLNQILSLLLGQTPEEWIQEKELLVYPEEDSLLCSTADRRYFWNLNRDHLINDFLIYEEGKENLEMKGKLIYNNFTNSTALQALQLEIPKHRVTITIRISQAVLDQVNSEELFVIN